MSTTCDFCKSAYDPNDEEYSLVFYFEGTKVNWDGYCREGSKIYFSDYDTDFLTSLLALSEQVLEEDPIRYQPPFDSLETHARKIFISNEIWRGTQEVNYRILEN